MKGKIIDILVKHTNGKCPKKKCDSYITGVQGCRECHINLATDSILAIVKIAEEREYDKGYEEAKRLWKED